MKVLVAQIRPRHRERCISVVRSVSADQLELMRVGTLHGASEAIRFRPDFAILDFGEGWDRVYTEAKELGIAVLVVSEIKPPEGVVAEDDLQLKLESVSSDDLVGRIKEKLSSQV